MIGQRTLQEVDGVGEVTEEEEEGVVDEALIVVASGTGTTKFICR